MVHGYSPVFIASIILERGEEFQHYPPSAPPLPRPSGYQQPQSLNIVSTSDTVREGKKRGLYILPCIGVGRVFP